MDNDGRLTINDIADALGVSKTTVSRAISGKGRIGAPTRERVLTYINEHNYTPNAVAQGLAMSRTCNIGFIVPGDYQMIDIPFFQKCMFSISETASEMDYDVIVSSVSGNDIRHLERLITNHKVDGIILARTVENDPSIHYLLENHVPFVTLGTTEIPGVVQIDNDHYHACIELTTLLLLKGIQNMGLIGGSKSHVVNRKRYDGFIKAHEELSRPVNYRNIYLDLTNRAGIERAVDDLLESGVRCIVCMDDSICNIVMNKLSREGVLVPQDIRVASYYDSSLTEVNLAPNLSVTSIKFDVRQMGAIACRTLVDLIHGRPADSEILLGYNIILKSSTQSL
ncbi:MAG: LacI family transcriptional regulator [Alistipes sp.]|nr:LacI family transcriptional regulator [Alistipes sp.]